MYYNFKNRQEILKLHIDYRIICGYIRNSFLRYSNIIGPIVIRIGGIRASRLHRESCSLLFDIFKASLKKSRSGSSIWLEHLPVTQEVASSSLVRTALSPWQTIC